MKSFFKDIFEYHHYFNQKLIDLFETNSDALSDRTIPLFSHCLNAHQIWNARILKSETFGVHQRHAINECKKIDTDNYIRTMHILENIDFAEMIRYNNSKGQIFKNTVQDILFHISNHFTHHKGQLISDLRLNNIEPIVTDYIFYKR